MAALTEGVYIYLVLTPHQIKISVNEWLPQGQAE
jgi:hypothetical protein